MLTQEQVSRLADLARIKFSPEELAAFTKNLDGIVGYVDLIKEIPESAFAGIEPKGSVELMPLRGDADPRPAVAPRDLLACSPKRIVGSEVSVPATKG